MENNFSGSNGSDEDSYYTTIDSAPPKRRAGRTKFRETRHPVYKGVRQRNTDRWVCEVREPNKKSRIWLGTFPTAEMAARAHDVAAIALRGRSACLNFADSAWLLPAPESSSPRAIQKAAAEGAEAFRPAGGQERGNESGGRPGNAMSSSTGIDNCSGQVDGAFYMDDGLSLGMQGYFDMAQGMLIDPPPISMAMGDEEDEQEVGESSGEVSLWSYSI